MDWAVVWRCGLSSIEKAVEWLSRRKEPGQGDNARTPFYEGSNASPREPGNGVSSGAKVVVLDFEALGRLGFLTPETMGGTLAEQYGHLKRPLIRTASRQLEGSFDRGNLVAITSALRGEGKTFTALNLAMSIAMERDVSVVLVDADLIARSLTRLVGLSQADGLSDVLADTRVRLDEVVVETNVSRLAIVPAGQVSRQVTELLASKQMREVANSLSGIGGNRMVLFDTAPILVTSHATVMDELVGQVLIVVEEGSTPQQAVLRAVGELQRDKPVAMVLNKSSSLFKTDYSLQYGVY